MCSSQSNNSGRNPNGDSIQHTLYSKGFAIDQKYNKCDLRDSVLRRKDDTFHIKYELIITSGEQIIVCS